MYLPTLAHLDHPPASMELNMPNGTLSLDEVLFQTVSRLFTLQGNTDKT